MELLDSDFLFCLCNFAGALAIVLSVWKIGFCICIRKPLEILQESYFLLYCRGFSYFSKSLLISIHSPTLHRADLQNPAGDYA